jgi:hypothetical protein
MAEVLEVNQVSLETWRKMVDEARKHGAAKEIGLFLSVSDAAVPQVTYHGKDGHLGGYHHATLSWVDGTVILTRGTAARSCPLVQSWKTLHAALMVPVLGEEAHDRIVP